MLQPQEGGMTILSGQTIVSLMAKVGKMLGTLNEHRYLYIETTLAAKRPVWLGGYMVAEFFIQVP